MTDDAFEDDDFEEPSFDTRLFGIALASAPNKIASEIVRSSASGGVKIPAFVENVCATILGNERILATEGLFRVSGASADMERYKQILDECGGSCDLREIEASVLAGLLKLYFRLLPDPLFPTSIYDSLLSVVREEGDGMAKKIEALVKKNMPAIHLIVAKVLFFTLEAVASRCELNKMNRHNLAVVFAPNLLRPPRSNQQKSEMDFILQMSNDSRHTILLVALMIEHHDKIF